MRIPDSKTASKSDGAHSCALHTCVNFADQKFHALAVANFYRVRGQFLRVMHETCADILFLKLSVTMKESMHSSISLESL